MGKRLTQGHEAVTLFCVDRQVEVQATRILMMKKFFRSDGSRATNRYYESLTMSSNKHPAALLLLPMTFMASLTWIIFLSEADENHSLTASTVAEMQETDVELEGATRRAKQMYEQDRSLASLGKYEQASRRYLEHAITLYRMYLLSYLSPPRDFLSSFEERAQILMDVADEYARQRRPGLAEDIAFDLLYADLPIVTRAQKRAETMLLHYRFSREY